MRIVKLLVLLGVGFVLAVGGGCVAVGFSVAAYVDARDIPTLTGSLAAALLGLALAFVGANTLVFVLRALVAPLDVVRSHLEIRFRLALVVVALGAMAAVVIWQHEVSKDDLRAIEDVGDWQARKLELAAAAERDWDTLLAETESYERELERLRRILPDDLELDRFDEALGKWCCRQGVEVCAQKRGTRREGPLVRCSISISLCGDQAAIGELAEWPGTLRRSAGARLVGVTAAEQHGNRLDAELEVFALPGDDLEQGSDDGEPPSPEPKAWMWPFTSRVARAMADIEARRAEVAARSRYWEPVNRLMAARNRLEHTIDTINAIEDAQTFPIPVDPGDEAAVTRLLDEAERIAAE